MVESHGCVLQEYPSIISFIRQRTLGSSMSVRSGALRHANEDAKIDVKRNVESVT